MPIPNRLRIGTNQLMSCSFGIFKTKVANAENILLKIDNSNLTIIQKS